MPKFSSPIVFFGSGPVAAKALRLLAQDFIVEAVITKPQPKHHHGNVPVLETVKKLELPVFTATSKLELDNLLSGKKFKSRLGVLIDFGIIVSRKVIDNFPLGIINSHFSVLPQWRGADPITFAVLSGQKITGVSLMLLVEAMDEGPLLAYGEYELPAGITTPDLTDKLIGLSHGLLVETIPNYFAGNLESVSQDITGRQVSYSRKLTKSDGEIDWQKPAEMVEREVRAFAGWPKSQAALGSQDVIILKVKVINKSGEPGSFVSDKQNLTVYCGQKALEILELQPTGKRAMSAQAFLNGYGRQLGLT